MIARLVYLANARLPTEKAHGYQICKMCEAFAHRCGSVSLLHPYREQPDPSLRDRSVFDYYAIPPKFDVRTLPNWDVVPLNDWLPTRVFTPVFFAHRMIWGRYVTSVAQQEKGDLYFTRYSEIAYWLVAAGLPTVYEAHDVPERGTKWLLRRIVSRSALRLVVTVTCSIRDRIAALGLPGAKIIALSNGVDLGLFDHCEGRTACRRRLGLPNDRAIIGYIGRFRALDMEKGIPELVQAIARLSSSGGKAPLLLCVGGPMESVPAYRDLARRFGVGEDCLKFVDRVPNTEVPHWIRACDVVTIPWPRSDYSAYVTSPLKLFEYMAAGVPIVASDLPSIRDILRHGENAWLVEPGSPEALASGIASVLTDAKLMDRLARRARQQVPEYTWQRRAEKILVHPSITDRPGGFWPNG